MPAYQPLDQFTVLNDEQSSESVHNYPADKAEYMLSVFPSILEFTDTRVGLNSSPIPLVLINTGYSPIVIAGVTVVGSYELVSEWPQTLEPDQAVSISIRFVPKFKGSNSGGVYIETGNAAGSEFISLTGHGSSPYVADLSTDIIRATNTGLGTLNAIQATTDDAVPLATGVKLIALDIVLTNSGAATVQFNNATALTILEVDGTALEASDLVAGTMVLGYVQGTNFRLITNAADAAALYLLNEHKDAAQTAAINAEADAVAVAAIYANFMSFISTVDLANIPANSQIVVTVAVNAAILGDVFIGASMNLNTAGIVFQGYVSASNVLTLIAKNTTNADINLGSGTLKVKLLR